MEGTKRSVDRWAKLFVKQDSTDQWNNPDCPLYSNKLDVHVNPFELDLLKLEALALHLQIVPRKDLTVDHTRDLANPHGTFGIVRPYGEGKVIKVYNRYGDSENNGSSSVSSQSTHIDEAGETIEDSFWEILVLTRLKELKYLISLEGLLYGKTRIAAILEDGGRCMDHIDCDSYVFKPEHLATYLPQLYAAIRELHHHEYVHRDVKPSNILIKGTQLKLCDANSFAKIGSRQGENVTTMYYAAPEILENQIYIEERKPDWESADLIKVSPASDIWSVGVVVLWILARMRCTDIPFPKCGQSYQKMLKGQHKIVQMLRKRVRECAIDERLRVDALSCLKWPIGERRLPVSVKNTTEVSN